MAHAARRNPIGSVGASSNAAATVSGPRPVSRFSRLSPAPSLRVFPTAPRLFRRAALSDDQTIDDSGRLRSMIDAVADKYERRRPAVGVHFATQQEAAKLIQTAVNIAEDASERHCSFRVPLAF
jgi:hypothetical protein